MVIYKIDKTNKYGPIRNQSEEDKQQVKLQRVLLAASLASVEEERRRGELDGILPLISNKFFMDLVTEVRFGIVKVPFSYERK